MNASNSVEDSFLNSTTTFRLHTGAVVSQSLIIILIVFGSLCGNSLTLIAIWKYRTLQTITSAFVANLAVADLLTCVITGPFILSSTITGDWPFSYPLCQFQGFCTLVFCATSINTLMFVAIDRYVAITDPLHYHIRVTKTLIFLFLTLAWLQPAIFGFSPLLGWGQYVYISDEYICSCGWNVQISLTITIIVLNLAVPTFVTIFCYWHIFKVAREHSRKVAAITIGLSRDAKSTPQSQSQPQSQCNTSRHDDSSRRRRTDTKAAKILLIVIGTFLFCWIPHTITIFCIAFTDNTCNLPPIYGSVSTLLALMNSACNPVLYGILNRQMRMAYINIVCQRRLEHGLSVTSEFSHGNHGESSSQGTR
ncbi:octopamine receptor beta-2R-like [Amphiura filiformis]|uniref:octopamine receptor beta-2R-like n=1 Tax=Amphiura filiformis TaxID=82378 RepID=UPI003B22254C